MDPRLTTPGGWHPRFAALHGAGFGVLMLAAGCWGLAGGVGLSVATQLAALAPAVLLLGIPHGAFDGELGHAVFSRSHGTRWWRPFLIFYLGLAAAVVVAWWLSPLASLTAFLALSACHFGLCDRDARLSPGLLGGLEAAARGAAPILLPVVFHPDATAGLFSLLVATPAATLQAMLSAAAPALGLALSAALAVAIARHLWLACTGWAAHAAPALELIAVLLAGATLPPLLFFALYFCLGHSPRHALEIAAACDPESPRRALSSFVRGAAPLSLATWLLFVLAGLALSGGSLDVESMVRVLFVGLAALTLPHFALQLLLRRVGSQALLVGR